MHISIWLTNPVVKAWNASENHKKKLEESLPECTVSLHNSSQSFKDNLINTDIALVWVFNQKWLEMAPKLKWIATPSAGKDWFNIDVPERMIVSYGAFHGKIIAENVIGAILGFIRGLNFAGQFQDKYLWPREEIEPYCNTLRGSHLVILGFGKIGNWIAKLAKPFGAKITGVKRVLMKPPYFFDEKDKIITIDDLDSILPKTDHLVLALPRDKSTDNIIDKRKLELLPNHCYIYNIGRGNAINEEDLAYALKNNVIKGAYLDVFKEEPLDKNSPLRYCPNILRTPHSSAMSPNFLDLFIEEFIERYKKWKENF
ncbi:MAG: D-2-hydroxyacid dehydrogenase [Promethearchaeota archaeon]